MRLLVCVIVFLNFASVTSWRFFVVLHLLLVRSVAFKMSIFYCYETSPVPWFIYSGSFVNVRDNYLNLICAFEHLGNILRIVHFECRATSVEVLGSNALNSELHMDARQLPTKRNHFLCSVFYMRHNLYALVHLIYYTHVYFPLSLTNVLPKDLVDENVFCN